MNDDHRKSDEDEKRQQFAQWPQPRRSQPYQPQDYPQFLQVDNDEADEQGQPRAPESHSGRWSPAQQEVSQSDWPSQPPGGEHWSHAQQRAPAQDWSVPHPGMPRSHGQQQFPQQDWSQQQQQPVGRQAQAGGGLWSQLAQQEQYSEQAFIAEEESNKRGVWSTPGTLLIVALNIGVYLAMGAVSNGVAMFSPNFSQLRFFGGNLGALTFAGEPWRLVTCCFVHSGLVHIGMNMYILWDIGRAVENIYGTSKYLYAYLIAGIGGALTSLYFHNNIISVGASGAVFGTFGAFLAFFLAHRSVFPKEVVQSAVRSVLVYLVANLLIGFSVPGIDNAAHIGGFIFGLVAGLAVVPRSVYDRGWKVKDLFLAVLLIGVLFGIFNYEDTAFNRQ